MSSLKGSPSLKVRMFFFSTIVVAAVGVGRPLLAADKPKAGATAARWQVKADPPAQRVKWPDKLKLSIVQPDHMEDLLFPKSDSEFVLASLKAYESERGELWNLTTGKRVGAINGTPIKAHMKALSPDGKYLAILSLNSEQTKDVEVWSLASGKRVSAFVADDRAVSVTILDFAGPGEVLIFSHGTVNGKFVHHLRIWDAESGQVARAMDLEKSLDNNNRGNYYDISPGRKWLATLDRPDVVIYDLESGQIKGMLTPPTRTEDGKSVSFDTVRFSPDGTEIALMSEGSDGAVLAIHDMATGDKKLAHELPRNLKSFLQHPASYLGPHVEFVDSPAGFLWYGDAFIDRETGTMLWTYRQGILEFSHWKRTLTPAGLIVSVGATNAKKLQVLPFPADKIEKSFQAYRKEDTKALVKPGEKVKVTVKVTEVRFGRVDEAQKSIETVIAERLAEDGLEVGADGTTVMAVQYQEKVGKTLQEVKGGTVFGGGTPTGKTVQSTAGELQIKWTSKDGKTTIYEHKYNLDPNRLMIIGDGGDVTDAKARQQVFGVLKVHLAGLPMPFFVPLDKALASLPVTTTSDQAAPLSPQDAMKAKIEAKKKKISK